MEDVIQIDSQFYLLATSSFADDRSRVLKYGQTFGVFSRFGDIESIGLGEQGIFHEGTRYLSRFAVKLGGEAPQLLRSSIRDDNAFLTVDAMNVDLSDSGGVAVPRGALHLFRSKFLYEGVCYEQLRLSNYSLASIDTAITCEFAADYRDIFEVRGTQRERRGTVLPTEVRTSEVVFGYRGMDAVVRRTKIVFSIPPDKLDERRARFAFSLAPKEDASLFITTTCEQQSQAPAILSFDSALRRSTESIHETGLGHTRITTSDVRFNAWMSRSTSDLRMMMVGNPEGEYPYAGVPWFSTVFGRDGIITALECLWVDPMIAKNVLRYLGEVQATEVDRERDAEPGKIVHETRGGEMAALREIPFGRYYGSIDSTPLFVMLAGAYLERTNDLAFIAEIWPNIHAAMRWIDEYGDVDRDGFVEYQSKSSRGLIQQGWKDSHDAVFYEDGRIAEPPIALCEVQGYVYAAKIAGAQISRALGEREFAQRVSGEASELKGKFNRDFWDDELGTFALALDGAKRMCKVTSSNPGHCLFTGIATDEHAARVAASLVGEELFSGWGIRTLGTRELRYNPMSYHNGSVWPHDNALAASGLARYGFADHAAKIFSAMLDVSDVMELRRLPELFCGFHRRTHMEGPTLYPVACSPQSWAAGAVYMLLQACLGLRVDPRQSTIEVEAKRVPDFLSGLTIHNLPIGDTLCYVAIRQDDDQLRTEIVRQAAEAKIKS
jgi:glycogen debranching enzyme